MGVVYLARNKIMDRLEVLKVVGKQLLDHPGAAERFLREIRAAANLSHPHIVTAYSAFQAGDLLVFAMEYVEGQNLSDHVRQRGGLPVVNACYYAQQVAQGLQQASDRGMVHRDIKPQNLILAKQGKKHTVKILDFGLAKATREGEAEDTGLTGAGAMLGTPDYIAPEQTMDAAKADIRADIYSLGCTLYFLLSGAPPFKGKSTFEILQAHLSNEATALDRVRTDVPAELAAVVAKMMAKDPARRYQKPSEVAQALAPFVQGGLKAAPGGGSGGTAPPSAEHAAAKTAIPLGARTMVESSDTIAKAIRQSGEVPSRPVPLPPPRQRSGGRGLVVAGLLAVVAVGGGTAYLLNQGSKKEADGGSGQDSRVDKADPKQQGGRAHNVAAGAGATGPGAASQKVSANLRTTVNSVDYEVAGSRFNGRVWELTVKAMLPPTAASRNGSLYFLKLEATTEDGKKYQLPLVNVLREIVVRRGESVPIKISMSALPPTVTKLARVALIVQGAKAQPIVFLDVPVEPDPEVVAALAAKKGDSPEGKVPPNLRTTANFVDYEVVGSRWNGRVWELTIRATARQRNRSVAFRGLQAATEDGTKYQLPLVTVMKETRLPMDEPVPIKITMSTLPPTVTKLAQVALIEHVPPFAPKPEPIVFVEVPIEPDPEVQAALAKPKGGAPDEADTPKAAGSPKMKKKK
jgi:hypothetical protein